MSDKRIIYTTADGSVAVIIPAPNTGLSIEQIAAKDVPPGVPFDIVDAASVPADRTFRGAWRKQGRNVEHDMATAKLIAHDRRRAARAAEFAPHDEVIAKQIPGRSAAEAEAARQAIRAKYDAMQTAINAASTVGELKAEIPG